MLSGSSRTDCSIRPRLRGSDAPSRVAGHPRMAPGRASDKRSSRPRGRAETSARKGWFIRVWCRPICWPLWESTRSSTSPPKAATDSASVRLVGVSGNTSAISASPSPIQRPKASGRPPAPPKAHERGAFGLGHGHHALQGKRAQSPKYPPRYKQRRNRKCRERPSRLQHGIKGSFIVLAETGSHSSDSTHFHSLSSRQCPKVWPCRL